MESFCIIHLDVGKKSLFTYKHINEGMTMLYTYKQCLKNWGTPYLLKQALQKRKLFQIEKGIYADTEHASSLAVITTKYPKAIITLDSAFFFHGLTDVIPYDYCLATSMSSRALRDKRIRQIYVKDSLLSLGCISMTRKDATFQIYDKERMLIELLRFKNKIPYDFYKEILNNYRKIVAELDIERIQNYAENFPKHKMLCNALETEFF